MTKKLPFTQEQFEEYGNVAMQIETQSTKQYEKGDSKIQTKKTSKDSINNYVRVGDEYFKEVFRPDKTGTLYRLYVKRSRQTIIDDFEKHSLKEIKRYEGFVNIPSHTNYNKEFCGYFNEYHELSYKPSKGECNTILELLTHIFGESYYDFALDYLQILYTKPLQRLPILLLESAEKGTGKSTFGDLVRIMFEENVIKLGNADLESQFNAHWSKKLAIIVDETSLDSKPIMQMLKRLSTEMGKITVNEKNKAQSQIEFFGKFIFMSNDVGKALPIENGDNRFAVFKVPTFKENGVKMIPNIEEILRLETPAFVDFLLNRKLSYPEKGRLYFEQSVYQTPQLHVYFKNTASYIARAIIELVKDTFAMLPEQKELCFSVSNIISELNGYVRNLDRSKIKKALEEEMRKEPKPKGRYTYHSLRHLESNPNIIDTNQYQNNVHYVFSRDSVEY